MKSFEIYGQNKTKQNMAKVTPPTFPSILLMRQVSPPQAQRAVEQVLCQWGMPQKMRFDNGYPFANTGERNVPTPLCLWLVAIGIEVIFNRPYCPQ